MSTTSIFITAEKNVKPQLINYKLNNISTLMHNVATEINLINGWLHTMPTLIEMKDSDNIDIDEFRRVIRRFKMNADHLTEQLVSNDEEVTALIDYASKK
jgi:hypothetical protein